MGTIGKKYSEKYDGTRIELEELIKLIEKNNGPDVLCLIGKDFSAIKLNKKTIQEYEKKFEFNSTNKPAWISDDTGGINLEGAILSYSNFSNSDLSEANLKNVDLRGADLTGVDLIDSDLRDSILWDAKFDNAVLDGANLKNANIFGANFRNSTLTKDSIGKNIIQELKGYKDPIDINMDASRNRFWQASKIFRYLKSCFDSNANYKDASWAYCKARRMEKKLAFIEAKSALSNKKFLRFIKLMIKRISDCFVEKLCDYGENPWRVLFWIIFIWFLFGTFYWLVEGLQIVDKTSSVYTVNNLTEYLLFSLSTMVTIEPVDLIVKNLMIMKILMPLETLFAIALAGLFGFVLGNRINRI